MKTKFQFLFVYDDNSESAELIAGKKVKAIRISEDCLLSTDYFGTTGYTSYDAFEFACLHGVSLLTPKEAKIVQSRLSGVRMMLKKCGSHVQIDHKCLIWTADEGDGNYKNMEAVSLSDGKCKMLGCEEWDTSGGLLCKLRA